MAFDPGAIDTTLAAAAGSDTALFAELRIAFCESAERLLMALSHASTDEEWRHAALRLRGLAGSFGAIRLMGAAEAAADGKPGDLALVKRIERAIARF